MQYALIMAALSKPLDHNEPFELESDNETAEVEIDLQLSMQEKLARSINKDMNSKISSKSRTTKDVTSIVKKKLVIFGVEGKFLYCFQLNLINGLKSAVFSNFWSKI
jgi:hypothetical protein